MTAEIAALVDRCLLIGMEGTSPSPDFRRRLGEGLGGVILFRDNIHDAEQLHRLCADLQDAGRDLLIAVDEEGGDVTRLYARTGSPHPGNLALGALDDEELTAAVATDIGNTLAAAGVNLNLAPSADVNTNPDNPIIGTRSFGSDPSLVARHVAAYVRGLQSTGVAGSAKHFPGHGDTSTDSHLDLPVVRGDLTPHLFPFQAAIGAGVKTILTAHIVFPGLDDSPATLSNRLLFGLLREELGFDGVVITDSLTMAAISARYGAAEGAVRALAAGADLLCMNSPFDEQRAVRDHLVAAVSGGRLAEARLAEAAGRVTALARAHQEPAGAGRRHQVGWTPALRRRLLHIDASVPLPGSPYVAELAAPRRGIDLTAGSLLAVLRTFDENVDGTRMHGGLEGEAAHAGLSDVLGQASGRPLILVVRDAHRDPGQGAAVESALRLRPDAVVVGIGTAADARLAPGRYIGTHGGARPNLRAAAEALLGTLPESVPGH